MATVGLGYTPTAHHGQPPARVRIGFRSDLMHTPVLRSRHVGTGSGAGRRLRTGQQHRPDPARQVTVIGEVQEPSPTGSAAGSRSERTVLTAMLRHVRRGDTVRAASMDRLTRSVVDLAQLVTEPAERGVRVAFIAA